MQSEQMLRRAEYLSHRFQAASFLLLAVAGLLLLVAVLIPVKPDDETVGLSEAGQFRPLPLREYDTGPLLARIAGMRLIRPTQAQAAVKDSGAAKQLAKNLKLHGVVETGGELVAYIQVEKQGVKTVRKGETVLDFTVERIEPAKVLLSLQGVEVWLQH